MTPHIIVIDYGSGNLRSVANALAKAAPQAKITVTSEADVLAEASHIVLPGVGAFRDCYTSLAALPGMLDSLEEQTGNKARPFLGICVGMQMMAERGEENGQTNGLGWIEGTVAPLQPADPALKIPHMGWNTLSLHGTHTLLEGIAPQSHAYFVHSYGLSGGLPAQCLASTDYGGMVPALVASGNRVGTQFHPEKSQHTGLRLLSNFASWKP